MNENAGAGRVAGLDTLRAVAIGLVLMSHYGFASHAPTFGVVGSVGWAGVDLFFVLSGFLIGHQITAPAARGEPLSLKVFFARRLLRTLPNYYVVLAAYFLLPGVPAGSGTAPAWRFLTFTQNFGLAYGETFTHSWSLCVEEQFYVVLPLAALLLMRFSRSPRTAWWALGGAVAAGVALRGLAFLEYGYEAFSAEIYYSSFARFDELLFGVAIAVLANFHGTLYARILRRGRALLFLGLAGAVGVLACFANDFPNAFLVTALGYSLLAASFALLVLAALSPGSPLHRLRIPGAAQLARWSYAIYLVHKPLFMWIGPQLAQRHVDASAPAVVALVLGAGVAGGWLLYRLVELPFMRLRARWFPQPPGRVAAPAFTTTSLALAPTRDSPAAAAAR